MDGRDEHPWREDLEILRKKQSPLYDQIGALISELNKARNKNKALKGWIYALCTLTLLISIFWWSDHTQKAPVPNYSSEETDAKLSQAKSLARTEGYQEGYSVGKDAGYQSGYDAGKAENIVQFYTADESPWGDGYDAGYAAGYIDGSKYLETVASTEVSKEADTTNYDTGYSDGYTQGYEEGAASVAIADSEATSGPSSASNDTSTPQVVETPAPTVTTYDYIINTNTGKFHYSWCSSVGKMNESNKWYYNGTHDDVVNMGYIPCKRCCP